MENLTHALGRLEAELRRKSSGVVERLQVGLTRAEIDDCVSRFAWALPQNLYDLYQWRNGLSGPTGKLSLVDRLLRRKDKWHGELSGAENESRVVYEGRSVTAKFMPLEYALAGYRHLKLGRCPLDLLPVFVIADGKTKHYCMVPLVEGQSVVYCADGTKAPPWGITQEYLSAQPQFGSLASLVSFLADYARTAEVNPPAGESRLPADGVECEIAAPVFNELCQQHRG